MSGTFKFTWAHPAEEVYVTGTFDNWTKSEKLEKVGDSFEKTVTLPDATQKIYYKFVVDNNWITDHTAPQEPDLEGNVNNFLTPEQIAKVDPAAAIMNSVAPESTTAALAKDVPLEKKAEAETPGGFPVTPSDELEDKTVSVDPIPATDVTVPSVPLAPGEPIPPSAKAGDVNAAVTLDKASYEKSDRLPGLTDENSTLPEATKSTIPESSLPAAGVTAATISTVTPEATTVGLAAQVPKASEEVPEPVKESQEKAGVEPEASADPVEIGEKAAVEDELKAKVPEAPSTAEGTSGFGTEKSETAGIAATIATAGGIAAAAAAAAKDAFSTKAEPTANQAADTAEEYANKAADTVDEYAKKAYDAAAEAAVDLPDEVKEKLPEDFQKDIKAHAQEEAREEVAPNAPTEVKESITAAADEPEAAANTSAVVDKQDVEAELLKEVKPVPAIDEEKAKPAEVKEDTKPAAADADADKSKPEELKDEAKEAVIKEKAKAEELKDDVKAKVKDEPKDPPKEALAEESKDETKKEAAAPAESSKNESKPETANGASPATAAQRDASPASGAADSDKKKKNRLSAFIGKIKNKVHHKD